MKVSGKRSQRSQRNFTKRMCDTTVRVGGTESALRGKGFQKGGVSNLQDGAADEPTWGEQIEHRSSEEKGQEIQKLVVYCNFNVTYIPEVFA